MKIFAFGGSRSHSRDQWRTMTARDGDRAVPLGVTTKWLTAFELMCNPRAVANIFIEFLAAFMNQPLTDNHRSINDHLKVTFGRYEI